MRISRYIIPLSFILMFVVNFYAISLVNPSNADRTSNNIKPNFTPVVEQGFSEAPITRIGSTITDGQTTLTTNKNNYSPGETLTVTAESKTNDMNGSLEWRLESPIGEIPFDFYSDLQRVFIDPTFDNPSHPDWINELSEPFNFVNVTSGFLNLTVTADSDEKDNEIYYYNSTALDNGERYRVSFEYQSKGKNLLVNPSFESGGTGWIFNSSHVQVKSDANNASEGTSYAFINGTEGFLLKQNITTGFTANREITFSAKATGTTLANYWHLRLEAYNSTDHLTHSLTTPTDSQGLPIDEKGYAFNKILRWKIPKGTVKLAAIFYGIDSGSEADGLYTGRLDDLYLAEAPPALKFSYWAPKESENGQWKNITIQGGNHEWERISTDIDISGIAPNINKTFRFFLDDQSTATNITTAYWFIDNLTLNLVTKPAVKTEITTVRNTGTVSSTWIHRNYEDRLASTYNIKADEQIDVAVPPNCKATITLQLPKHQIYFGSWIFMLSIHREDKATSEYMGTKRINISFILEDKMNYVLNDIYMLRGSTNKTIENNSVFTEYFEQETDVEAISPGDNVTILGYLEANSTPNEWYDLKYLLISSATVEFTWFSNWVSKENITWIERHFITYSEKAETVLDGNFSSPYDNIQSLGLNFEIPNRGIFGDLTANLTITLTNTNPKPGGIGGLPHTIEIPLILPPVRFRVNVTDENLPSTNYYLTEYIEGNISVNFINFKENLSEIYPDRNITINISIPMSDLDLTVILENEAGDIQEINMNYIGHTILWFDKINPHLPTGAYEFWIRWKTPYKQNITDYERIKTTTHTVNIQGTLEIPEVTEIPEVLQGDSRTINFTVILSEKGKFVGGLNLKGVVVIDESNSSLIIYEEDGVYKINLDTGLNTEPKEYTIQIFLIGRTNPLGEINFEVIEREDIRTDKLEPIDLIINIGGIAVFLIIGIGVVSALFWVNKSTK